MAASMGRQSWFRKFSRLSRLKCGTREEKCKYSSDSKQDVLSGRSNWVVFTDDGRTIVCWHPEPQFPYECSKPLPILDEKLKEGDSPLKVQYRLDDLQRNRPGGPTRLELQALTFTNKHIWFPQKGKRYRKPNPPEDRDGL